MIRKGCISDKESWGICTLVQHALTHSPPSYTQQSISRQGEKVFVWVGDYLGGRALGSGEDPPKMVPSKLTPGPGGAVCEAAPAFSDRKLLNIWLRQYCHRHRRGGVISARFGGFTVWVGGAIYN